MGKRGPVPKRSNQRRRENAPEVAPTRAPGAASVEVPPADPAWNPVAARWYESLAESGQSAFYEPSDWAVAWLLAESMSRELEPQPLVVGSGADAKVEMHRMPPKAASVAAWLKGMSQLIATEGDRRRVGLELQRSAPDEGGSASAGVTDLRAWRESLNA